MVRQTQIRSLVHTMLYPPRKGNIHIPARTQHPSCSACIMRDKKMMLILVPRAANRNLRNHFPSVLYNVRGGYYESRNLKHVPNRILKEQLATYTCFACVRHPVLKLFSMYKTLLGSGGREQWEQRLKDAEIKKDSTFYYFLNNFIDLEDGHFTSQSDYVPRDANIMKLETLYDDLSVYNNLYQWGLDVRTICATNKWRSERKIIHKNITQACVDMIAEKHKEDFERYGYTLDLQEIIDNENYSV